MAFVTPMHPVPLLLGTACDGAALMRASASPS